MEVNTDEVFQVTVIHFQVYFSISVLNTTVFLKLTMVAKMPGSSMLKSFKYTVEHILFFLDRWKPNDN